MTRLCSPRAVLFRDVVGLPRCGRTGGHRLELELLLGRVHGIRVGVRVLQLHDGRNSERHGRQSGFNFARDVEGGQDLASPGSAAPLQCSRPTPPCYARTKPVLPVVCGSPPGSLLSVFPAPGAWSSSRPLFRPDNACPARELTACPCHPSLRAFPSRRLCAPLYLLEPLPRGNPSASPSPSPCNAAQSLLRRRPCPKALPPALTTGPGLQHTLRRHRRPEARRCASRSPPSGLRYLRRRRDPG